jgi:polyhydroxyalkanoate synthesis regulator protein
MDATQRLIKKLVERRMQNTGESQAVATANVMAAFEKLKKKET